MATRITIQVTKGSQIERVLVSSYAHTNCGVVCKEVGTENTTLFIPYTSIRMISEVKYNED